MGKCNKDGILRETNFARACVMFALLLARSEVTMERWMNEERDSMGHPPPPLPLGQKVRRMEAHAAAKPTFTLLQCGCGQRGGFLAGQARNCQQTVCTTLRTSLFGTFLQTLPELVMPLKGHSLSPRSCPPGNAVAAPSERFGSRLWKQLSAQAPT